MLSIPRRGLPAEAADRVWAPDLHLVDLFGSCCCVYIYIYIYIYIRIYIYQQAACEADLFGSRCCMLYGFVGCLCYPVAIVAANVFVVCLCCYRLYCDV